MQGRGSPAGSVVTVSLRRIVAVSAPFAAVDIDERERRERESEKDRKREGEEEEERVRE